MTENELREIVAAQAESWLGRKEADESHREIIDVYNRIVPLPRGYRMTYTDPWCAAFVSAVAQACGLTDIIFPECACEPMIALYKQHGRWKEDDDYVPKPGDVIFFDWQDTGIGDNTGSADHVGIVTDVDGRQLILIEGNCGDAVCRRVWEIDGLFIRGYGLPDYAGKAEENPFGADAPPPLSGEDNSGADGPLPPEGEDPYRPCGPLPPEGEDPYRPCGPLPPEGEASTGVAEGCCAVELPSLRIGDKSEAVRAAQALLILRRCGVGPDGADGDFGPNTRSAVRCFQARMGLDHDGVIGPATWDALLRG